MTKKDYELIASVLRERLGDSYDNAYARLLVKKMADVFEAHNPKFNRSKFLKACGIEEV